MTERYHSLTVVLEQNIREDDAQAIISAISALRHVLAVGGNVADGSEYVAEMRVRNELGQKLWDVLYPKKVTG